LEVKVGHPVDKLFSGLFLAATVTMVILFMLSVVPVKDFSDGMGLWHSLSGLAIAACIVFPRPVLMRTLMRDKRSPFLLDSDVECMLLGRVMGLVFGLAGTLWLCRIVA
jgi:hypothetical protein